MPSPLRVAYIVQQFAPEIGAGPARVLEMGRRWQELGAEVTVVTAMPNRPAGRIHPDYAGRAMLEERIGGLRVLRSWLYATRKHGFGRTFVNNVSFAASALAHTLMRLGTVDVIIASSPPFFVHLTGDALRVLRRAPVVLELRDMWPDYLVGMGVIGNGAVARGLFSLERHLLTAAQHVVVVTDSFKERVVGKGIAPERITVIPNGVDTSLYYATAEPAPVAQLERRGSELIVGYLGNFGYGQHLSTLLDAAAILQQRAAPVRLVLAGDGADRELLLRQRQEMALANVEIIPPVQKELSRAFYNACDACLVPLAPVDVIQETIPSKLFEVLACERPVIASMGGEGARIVRESGAGLVVGPGDASAIAAAVLDMARLSGAQRRELGARGHSYVAEHYARRALADRYFELLGGVVRDAQRTRS